LTRRPAKLTLACSDIWAIGVITYFLLCGYTPFDRDSNLEEMQAILVADYSFTPIEYWRGVSQYAREFIKRCLTVDPRQRITAHQALQHVWIKPVDPSSPEKPQGDGEDLLPVVKKNFNARRTLHKAIDTVRAINKLREGGGLMHGHMDGAMSVDPKPKEEMVNGSKVMDDQGQPMEGLEGMAQGGGEHTDQSKHHDDNDAMEVDSRSNARGQTEDQIRAQEKKIHETVSGLWTKNKS
jgi:calcium/calmodulin-dependent protein kinase I